MHAILWEGHKVNVGMNIINNIIKLQCTKFSKNYKKEKCIIQQYF